MQAYLNLGRTYELETLEVGPLEIDTPSDGVTQYSPIPDDCRAISQVSIDISGQGKYVPMYPTDYRYIRRTTSVSPGRPARYARWGNQLWYDRIPDQTYPVQLSYWQKPQIVFDESDTVSDVETTPLLLPDDWFELLDYMATYRGWDYLEDALKVMETKALIWGDPTDPRKGPGMLKALLTARQAEAPSSEYGIQPVILPTCWVK
jgi:hypothetical protein